MKRTDKLREVLEQHHACQGSYEFAKDLTLEQFHATCQRGDWMLWLFSRLQPEKESEIRLAAAHCANTVRPLMQDQRSTDLVDWLIDNNGAEPPEKMQEEAQEAYTDALATANAACAAYGSAGAAGAAFTALDVFTVCTAFYADYAVYAASACDSEARDKNRLQTADICREYLPLEMWEERE